MLQADLIEDERVARVTVPENQLSLAIGKEGQMPGWQQTDWLEN